MTTEDRPRGRSAPDRGWSTCRGVWASVARGGGADGLTRIHRRPGREPVYDDVADQTFEGVAAAVEVDVHDSECVVRGCRPLAVVVGGNDVGRCRQRLLRAQCGSRAADLAFPATKTVGAMQTGFENPFESLRRSKRLRQRNRGR